MTTSKSPLKIAHVAYAAARKAFSDYSHKFSPKKFTQPQLVACLVLKEFFKKDYRGIEAILLDSSDLQKELELPCIPHYTTLQKASQKFFKTKGTQRLITGILAIATKIKLMDTTIARAAMDGTGFESHHVSSYFINRREYANQDRYQTTTYTRYPKVGLVCDTKNHLILSGIPERGPQFDGTHYKPALVAAAIQKRIKLLLADAGYDSEGNHIFARTILKIKTLIPARIGRPTAKLPSGKYRRLMVLTFNKLVYGQRWQVETVMSMLKRNLDSFLRARTYRTQCKEILLRLFTHNVMIVLPE